MLEYQVVYALKYQGMSAKSKEVLGKIGEIRMEFSNFALTRHILGVLAVAQSYG